jgi:hypothetical protein
VGAVLVDEAELARAVAVEDELLVHDLDLFGAQRLARQLVHGADRVPVVAHQLAHRRSGTAASQ